MSRWARSWRSSALIVAGIAVAALPGCGAGQPKSAASAADFERALAGAPPTLARLYGAPGRVLDGGPDAFERQIAGLRGHPVVVNKWASWCGPCRFEFPTLQKLSAHYGRRVAFLGVNSQDSDDAASTFLEEAPVPYPSYTDPDKKIAAALHATLGLPDTAFYDRSGKLVYLKQGPYTSPKELETDVQHYALGS